MFNYLGLKIFYYAIVATIVIAVIFTVKSLFIPLLISLFIAMMIRPLVTYFESKGFSHSTIIVSIYLAVTLVFIIAFIIILPIIAEQLIEFSKKLPLYASLLSEKVVEVENYFNSKFTFIDFTNIKQSIKDSFSNEANSFSSYISNTMNLLTYAMLVPFFAFFMLKDMHLMNKSLLSFVPNRYFEIFVLLFYKIGNSVQLYIRGQLIDASFVGFMTAIGLSIIGFPFALLVGLIAGIGNLVPYFGPILGAIPAILIILVTPEWATSSGILSVVSVFLIVQAIETIFVYPLAVGNSVNIHPLIIILALLIGGELAGIIGMIVIIPLLAIVKVTYELLNKYMSAYKIIRD